MWRVWLGALALFVSSAAPSPAETLQVFSAGSLTEAMGDLLDHFPSGLDSVSPVSFGSSGLLRKKIEGGAEADLFASADMDNAHALLVGHPDRMVLHFTDNSLCALARPAVGLTSDNMLDRLLDQNIRVGTSTPGADPAGDYAWAVFARAEALRVGARARLEAKALKLMGGGHKTPLLVPGKDAVVGIFLTDRADVMLGYCSASPAIQREVPGLVNVALPTNLSVSAPYGLVLLNSKPVALRFAAFVMSEPGQAILASHGFAPPAPAPAKPSSSAMNGAK